MDLLLWVVAGTVAGGLAGAGSRLLLGRLRRGTEVSPPGCEIAVAAVWAVVAAGWAGGALPPAWAPLLLGLGWLGVTAGVVDLRHHRLPDALTLPALPAALLLVAPLGPESWVRAAAGAGVAAVAHGAVHLVAPAAMGGGDVKLAAPLGAVLAASSWPALVLAATLASLLTTAGAAARLLAARPGTTVPRAAGSGRVRAGPVVPDLAAGVPRVRSPTGPGIPHGPSMLIATWVVAAAAAVGGGG